MTRAALHLKNRNVNYGTSINGPGPLQTAMYSVNLQISCRRNYETQVVLEICKLSPSNTSIYQLTKAGWQFYTGLSQQNRTPLFSFPPGPKISKIWTLRNKTVWNSWPPSEIFYPLQNLSKHYFYAFIKGVQIFQSILNRSSLDQLGPPYLFYIYCMCFWCMQRWFRF